MEWTPEQLALLHQLRSDSVTEQLEGCRTILNALIESPDDGPSFVARYLKALIRLLSSPSASVCELAGHAVARCSGDVSCFDPELHFVFALNADPELGGGTDGAGDQSGSSAVLPGPAAGTGSVPSTMAVTVRQAPWFDADFGWRVWDASVLLAQLVVQYRAHIGQAAVLELGAGCGLAGLTAARIGARVTLTDFTTPLLDNLRRNAQLIADEQGAAQPLGAAAAAGPGAVRVEALNWRQLDGFPAAVADLVLGADIVYEPGHVELVPAAAAHVCAPGGAVLLCMQTNHEGVRDVSSAFQRRGFVGGLMPALRLLGGGARSAPAVLRCRHRDECVFGVYVRAADPDHGVWHRLARRLHR